MKKKNILTREQMMQIRGGESGIETCSASCSAGDDVSCTGASCSSRSGHGVSCTTGGVTLTVKCPIAFADN